MRSQKTFEQAYTRLNQEQRLAVDAIEGPVMVLAGPGTGKTQILAMRVGRILQETHMDPENILCLTFTEAAAREMRERLVGLIGKAAYTVSIYTFHSFGNALIQEHPEKFSFARELLPLTDLERLQIFQESMSELSGPSALKPMSNPYLFVPALSAAVKSLKQEGMALKQYQRLIATLQQFLKVSGPLLADFAALTPKARTEAQYVALEKKLLAAAKEYKAAAEQLAAIFDEYRPDFGDSKVRTKLKQRLQQWHQQLIRQSSYQPVVSFVYERYQHKLTERGRYDYEDMILKVIERLKTDADLLADVQERWQYVLVDEYQDTNGAQNELLFLLAAGQHSPNVFVVGDDHQSIFRFQGASVENLLTFHSQYSAGLNLITLKANYRSPQSLLDAAWQVMQSSAEGALALPLQRPALMATRAEGVAPITVSAYTDETSEDYAVGRQIQALLAAEVAPPEIAVLYRFHADATSLITMLRQLAIPFQLEGNENVFTDRRVQQLITLLTYLVEPAREDLLAQLLYFDWWQLDPLAVMQVVHTAGHASRQAGRERQPLFDVLSRTVLFKPLLQRLANWKQLSQNETVQNTVSQILFESGLLQVADINSLYQVNRLLAEVRRFNRAEVHLSLPVLLERFTMMQENNLALEAPVPVVASAGVRLMTVHRAKGLEFEHVFVIRLTDGHWGNSARRSRVLLPPGVVRYAPVAARNEEERRLFYVAMTRAKQRLSLSYAQKDSRGRGQVASLFLTELPEQYRASVGAEQAVADVVPSLTVLTTVPARQPDQEMRAWLTATLQTYSMSVTHLNNYLKCPRLFYYRNLLRVPEFKPAHLTFGTAVHAALRDLMAAWGKEKASKTWLLKRYEQALAREVLVEPMRRDLLVLGQAVLGDYFDHYQTEFKGGALTEYNFSSHQVRVDDLRLTGLVDRIDMIDPERKLMQVVDYKTGNPDTKSSALKHGGDYWRQLVFYKLLADRSERFPYTVTHGEVDFVEPSKRSGKFVKKEYVLTDKDVQEVTEQIRSVWSDIKALKFLEAEGCGECDYCQMVH